ncbi:MAG: AAA family ATPase [Hyphomonas sp.]
MWQAFEARIDENEQDRPSPLRPAFFAILRDSGLRPGGGVTKKMVAFEFGQGDRLLWELEYPGRNFFLHNKWRDRLEKAGFACELRPWQADKQDGGRHTALSRDWSFKQADCIVLRIETADELQRLLGLLMAEDGDLHLDPAVITRWIDRLHHFFPNLDRFDRPDPEFDSTERTYKLEVADTLLTALQRGNSDQDTVDAIHAALVKSNLLQWRTFWPISPNGDADREKLWPAIEVLVSSALGPPDRHPQALESFVDAWMQAVPNPKADPARQIAEFLFMHLAPEDGVYIRYSVRQDFWREAVGSDFPSFESMADTYRAELKFMRAVKRAFEDRGLAPRDMIDVQSALWVVHNYSDKSDSGESTSPFSRAAIEAAMDAYEEFQKTGAHSDAFGSFGVPQDYWVRSTRQRAEPIFPSKALVGFLLKKDSSSLSGGWAQKSAAAQLHNAGFIIVDKTGNPISPPEEHKHLLRGADQIRPCALNYYIEPARESGAREVSIRASDIAKDLGLQNRFPMICNALEREEFQKLAGVPAPSIVGPNPSSSTVFTYQLSEFEGHERTNPEMPTNRTSALNLILYGPPGTGKTYATAWEAVKLCIGEEAAKPLKDDRDALMREYRSLVDEHRIEFVTFHQSFSYEDFVEGLRPTTETSASDDEVGSTPASGGFSLKPHDGVFKRISERARLDTTGAVSDRLDRSRGIFKITLGRRGEQEDRVLEGLENSLIHLGWGGDIDWSDPRYEEFDEIFKTWKAEKDPNVTGYDANVVQTWSFRANMQVDDYVVLSDGRDRFRAVGRVIGEYYYDPKAAYHPHRRKVEWIWRNDAGVERDKFYPNLFRRQSAYQLNRDVIDWDALERIVYPHAGSEPEAGARDFVLIIDEINRANISKVFGELITLLETDKRLGCQNQIRLTLPYSGMKFGVPSNLHIIGTMNTADRSIALLDTALRRRFTFRELMPDPAFLPENLDGINLRKLLTTMNERIEYLFDREHQIGHAYFTGCQTRADVEHVMRFKIIPLLSEYFYEDWSKVAAVLGDGRNGGQARFLEATSLAPPNGLHDDELGTEKLRWRVKSSFDFSEFQA